MSEWIFSYSYLNSQDRWCLRISLPLSTCWQPSVKNLQWNKLSLMSSSSAGIGDCNISASQSWHNIEWWVTQPLHNKWPFWQISNGGIHIWWQPAHLSSCSKIDPSGVCTRLILFCLVVLFGTNVCAFMALNEIMNNKLWNCDEFSRYFNSTFNRDTGSGHN